MKNKSQKRKNSKHENPFFKGMKERSIYNINPLTGAIISVRNPTQDSKDKAEKQAKKFRLIKE